MRCAKVYREGDEIGTLAPTPVYVPVLFEEATAKVDSPVVISSLSVQLT